MTTKLYNLYGVIGALVASVICLVVFIIISIVPNEGVTGADLVKYNGRTHSYIVGAVDVARIVDLNNKYMCDWSSDNDHTDTDMVLDVTSKIKQNKLLQAQPAAFAVLNAYHQSYCLNPPPDA